VVEYGQGPRSGSRDNGLRCAGYVAVGDLDPRVADALLQTLRQEGIAAYVTPSPRTQGGWLEVQAPDQLTDRLYADSEHAARAQALLAREREHSGPTETATPSTGPLGPAAVPVLPPAGPPADRASGDEPTTEIDFDSAWQQLLGSLQSTASQPTRPWPASEEVEQGAFAAPAPGTLDEDPVLDEHYVPPPPPPLPRLRKETIGGLAAMVLGILILGLRLSGGSFAWLGILAILLGAATLVWNVKDGPPRDSDGDDGAVV
jgi:hypothetical protein